MTIPHWTRTAFTAASSEPEETFQDYLDWQRDYVANIGLSDYTDYAHNCGYFWVARIWLTVPR